MRTPFWPTLTSKVPTGNCATVYTVPKLSGGVLLSQIYQVIPGSCLGYLAALPVESTLSWWGGLRDLGRWETCPLFADPAERPWWRSIRGSRRAGSRTKRFPRSSPPDFGAPVPWGVLARHCRPLRSGGAGPRGGDEHCTSRLRKETEEGFRSLRAPWPDADRGWQTLTSNTRPTECR